MDAKDDPYEILSVRSTATAKELASAYRKAALRYHPDKNPGDAVAEAMFAKVYAAFELLSSEELRQKVDTKKKQEEQSKVRFAAMDENRRSMKEALEKREREAQENEAKTAKAASAQAQGGKASGAANIPPDLLERMRREIARLRQEMHDEEDEQRRQTGTRRTPLTAAASPPQHLRQYRLLLKWQRDSVRTETTLRRELRTQFSIEDDTMTVDVSPKGAMIHLTSTEAYEKLLRSKTALRRCGLKVKAVDTTPRKVMETAVGDAPRGAHAVGSSTSSFSTRPRDDSSTVSVAPSATSNAALDVDAFEAETLAFMEANASRKKHKTT